jgi:hypothetical protein
LSVHSRAGGRARVHADGRRRRHRKRDRRPDRPRRWSGLGIRTVTTAGSDYYIQEDLHPDYLAQLALRSCIRQAYNGGAVRSGTCTLSGTGTDSYGDPRMTLG